MSFLEIIGGIVVAAVCIFVAILALQIIGNIYGGIKGAYRVRMIHARVGATIVREQLAPHWQTIKMGLRAWDGRRYRNGCGHYIQMGGMIVPVDGRDPIVRRHVG